MTLLSTTVLCPVPELTVEAFEDGAMVWDPHGEQLHRLDVPGHELWRLLDGQRTLEHVFHAVALTFGVAPNVVRRDALPFLADMVARGLLEERAH